MLINLLAFKLKITFGINSAVTKTIAVEKKVWSNNTKLLIVVMYLKKGSKTKAISIPYITNAILLPTNMVAIKREGLFNKGDKRRALNSPLFFINSMCSLLDAT